MKKLSMLLMVLLAMTMQSHRVFAQSVTITLIPGYNWISIPCADTLDFATALGSFTPAEGDVIKSQWSNAVYRNGHWVGQISQFFPGYGYMYKSNRSMPVPLTFNAQQPASQVLVTTSEPMLITAISAMGGGEVTVNDGTYILVKGLCWATHENPTTNDGFFEEAESGVGNFAISMTNLYMGTTYYVRAYAVTPDGTVYGDQKAFTTRDGIPTLTTEAIWNITGNSARSGGNITDDGGLNVTARGVCWSTSPNPTVNDSHTTDGTGMGVFTSFIMGLQLSTTYFVRAYVTTNVGTSYGNEVSFTTEYNLAYIDLGLPSGTLWATCNVGASAPEEYGDYFAWGETQPKEYYDWSTYQYCNGSENTLTKYCTDSNYGFNGFTDNLTTLLPEDDAATINWGPDWRMPTYEEWLELLVNTTLSYPSHGTLFTASNGNSIFLPSIFYEEYQFGGYADGPYWSSSLSILHPTNAYGFKNNWDIYAGDVSVYVGTCTPSRSEGRFVRPVRSLSQNTSIFVNAKACPTIAGTVNGGGIYQEGTECTLTATANDNYAFTNWTENGETISTDAVYSFTVTSSRSLVANFTYNGTVNVPIGAIDGLFSVSASQQVYFSQGNLQYIGSAATPYWKFADHQWDVLGTTTGQNSNSEDVDRDLFGWSTSGWNNGNMYYQPYDTEKSWDINDGFGYGPTNGTNYNYSLTCDYANSDWGLYNPISNGGNQTDQWRTLTQPEWNYVFNTRTTTSGIRYAKAKVNNVKGVILLPDNWSSSTYSLSSTNTYNASFSSNTLTALQWSTLEQAGAVFLPVAGYRDGTSVYGVGSYGYYWSASNYFSNARDVYFLDSKLIVGNSSSRYYGFSVRVVCPAE